MGKIEKGSHPKVTENLKQFHDPLVAALRLISVYGNNGVIVGGIASSLLGTPRYTVDIDIVLLIADEGISKLVIEAEKLGMTPRIHAAEEFAAKNRVLLLRHNISGTDIDIILGSLPFEVAMVQHSQVMAVGGLELRLPTPEDLIIMKTIAHREKDLGDIRTIVQCHPQLNREYIHSWLTQFEQALDQSDLWEQISKILQ
mgnify:CR=1 FL=1